MNVEAKTIDFPNEVRSSFASLFEKYGYREVSSTSHRIRYESTGVFIEIYYGAYDCEVAIEFGRLGKSEKFSFTGFLRLINPQLERQIGDRIAYDLHKVQKDLIVLAGVMQLEGESILKGENSIFEKMKGVRWWDFQPDALKEE